MTKGSAAGDSGGKEFPASLGRGWAGKLRPGSAEILNSLASK